MNPIKERFPWAHVEESSIDILIADGVTIGIGTVISDWIMIGTNTSIGFDVTLDIGARIGADAHIGSYSRVEDNAVIGRGAKIGWHCTIGSCASIAPYTELPPNSWIPDEVNIKPGDWFMHGGPIGSRNGIWFARWRKGVGLLWWVGCRQGLTTGELRERVADTHRLAAPQHYREYMAAIDMVESICPKHKI
jgi:UDP-3-O-[3-hydroxymyristoyl] glucosamine N-acyltransferase